MLRALATSSAGLVANASDSAFDLMGARLEAADGKPMSDAQKDMVVRSMGTMAEFARLADTPFGRQHIERESMLFPDPDYRRTAAKVTDLVRRHAQEWEAFVETMPSRGWARSFAAQL